MVLHAGPVIPSLLLAVLCALAGLPGAQGRIKVWQGPTTDFAADDNWAHKQGPPTEREAAAGERAVPRETAMLLPEGHQTTVKVARRDYVVGTRLLFGKHSRVQLAPFHDGHGTRFVFNGSAAGPLATFAPPAAASDFSCHKNWREVASLRTGADTIAEGAGIAAEQPPCSDDIAVLPAAHSYNIAAKAARTNVSGCPPPPLDPVIP